ncbi:MAG: hypothetical protein IPL61_02950 [Myxococcales bacterium]|nr:hypothetical protein [Myxococcales bacterium]
MARVVASWLLTALVLTGAAGCKQGEGEPCQYTSDCASGLTCVVSSHVCQSGVSIDDGGTGGVDAPNDSGIDAVVPDDAPSVIDATPLDADLVDAAPDA